MPRTEYPCPVCDRATLEPDTDDADRLRCPSCGATVPRQAMEEEARKQRLKALAEEAEQAFHREIASKLRLIGSRRASNRRGKRFRSQRIQPRRWWQRGGA